MQSLSRTLGAKVKDWDYIPMKYEQNSLLPTFFGYVGSGFLKRKYSPINGQSGIVIVHFSNTVTKTYNVWKQNGFCFVETDSSVKGLYNGKFNELIQEVESDEESFRKKFPERSYYFYKQFSSSTSSLFGEAVYNPFENIREPREDSLHAFLIVETVLAMHTGGRIMPKLIYTMGINPETTDSFLIYSRIDESGDEPLREIVSVPCSRYPSLIYPKGFVVGEIVNGVSRRVFSSSPKDFVEKRGITIN